MVDGRRCFSSSCRAHEQGHICPLLPACFSYSSIPRLFCIPTGSSLSLCALFSPSPSYRFLTLNGPLSLPIYPPRPPMLSLQLIRPSKSFHYHPSHFHILVKAHHWVCIHMIPLWVMVVCGCMSSIGRLSSQLH